MKQWYASKLVWLGVVQTLIGAFALVEAWLRAGDFSAAGVIGLSAGILTVILRVWFTDTKLV